MAYTGTGTQSDPYLVDNWTDFRTLCVRYGTYITLPADAPDKVLDAAGDVLPSQSDFYLRANITGNGWRIRNLFLGNYAVRLTNNHIDNLHFENLACHYNAFHDGAAFTNCSFSIAMTGTAQFISGSSIGYAVFENCRFSIAMLHTRTAALFEQVTALSGCTIALHGSTAGMELVNVGALTDCHICGSLTLEGGTLSLNNTAGNCVYTLAVAGEGAVLAETNCTLPQLVDVSLLADGLTVSISGQNWHGLTTAHLQDAAYLQDVIGFPEN